MRSPLLLTIIAVAISAVIAVIGQALDFSGPVWLVALIIAMLAISAFDPERFGWTAGPKDPRTPHRY